VIYNIVPTIAHYRMKGSGQSEIKRQILVGQMVALMARLKLGGQWAEKKEYA